MATKKNTIKDIFNSIRSGFSGEPITPQTGFSMRTQTLPNQGGSFKSPVLTPPNMSVGKATLQPTKQAISNPTGTSSSKPIFQPKQQTQPASNIPKQWINPETGGFYSPEEVANNIATSTPGLKSGDIPKYAGDTLTEGPKTVEDLQTDVATLNNARNDISIGEKDPYKVGAESGIAYTPAELAAIEKAYAGIYDPAINSALSKLDVKQKEMEAERQRKAKLEEMAIQHRYDLELKRTPTPGSGSGTSGGSGDFGATIDTVVNLVPTKFGQESTRQLLRGAINNKDYITAYNAIANTVGDNLSGETKTKFTNARRDILALDKMEQSIKKYVQDGGDMGLLKGTAEEIERKLGSTSGPSSALAVELKRAFQEYRADMSGAAFGAGESRDYESVNPSLKKSLNLNTDVISGAKKALENKIYSQVDSMVPSAKYIREYAQGAIPGQPAASSYSVGQIIESGGKKYRVTDVSDPNDPEVEPI